MEAATSERKQVSPDFQPEYDEHGDEIKPTEEDFPTEGAESVPDSPEVPAPAPEPTPEPVPEEDDGEGGELDEGEAGADEIEQLSIAGDYNLNLTVGGVKPTGSALKLRGGKIEVPGTQFKKGERIRVGLTIRIGGVHFDDQIGDDGEVKACDRKHVGRIEGVERLDDPPSE